MSQREKHHESTNTKNENLNLKIAQLISAALKAEYGEEYSSIKRIAKYTDASLSTIKKWYEGRNPPNSKHLIMLARRSPAILQALLTLLEKPLLWELYQNESARRKELEFRGGKLATPDIYTAQYCGINLMIDSTIASQLNLRQLWFIECVQRGIRVKAVDITNAYNISLRAAQSDVAGLIKVNLIRFVGSKKTGYYEMIVQN